MEDYKRYKIKRKEFGHGQSRNMNPGLTESYGETSFRGFTNQSNIGRDYEQNIGYRESYNHLDTGRELDSEMREWHQDENGLYKGRGPRSYHRKDERILEDINDRLCDNPYLDATDIEVSAKDGEVILSGFVENRDAKRMAEDISESVSGVKNIVNRLRVKVRGI